MTTPLPQVPSQAPPPRRSAYSMGSLPNMLRSLLVIGALLIVVIAIVPRPSQVDRPTVDAASVGRAVASATSWHVRLPEGLPADQWRPTVASDGPGTAGVRTFTTVWTTPSGADIALKQAGKPTDEWLARSVSDGAAGAMVTIGAQQWRSYATGDGSRRSLVLSGSGQTPTIVASGTASQAELTQFVTALAPVSG